MPLKDILDLFQKKFKQETIFHVLKSLTYFEDAEKFADPVVFDESITWKMIKSAVRQAVREITQ